MAMLVYRRVLITDYILIYFNTQARNAVVDLLYSPSQLQPGESRAVRFRQTITEVEVKLGKLGNCPSNMVKVDDIAKL